MPAMRVQPRSSARVSARAMRQAGKLDSPLAGASQIVKRAHNLLQRGHVVGEMRPQQIDTIGFQAFQAGLHRRNHVFTAVAGMRNTCLRRCTQRVFGGDDEAIAIGGDKFPHHLLRLAKLIGISRVNEIAAGINVTIEYLPGLFFFRAVTPAGAKGAGAQSQFGNAQAGVATKGGVFHAEPRNSLELNIINDG